MPLSSCGFDCKRSLFLLCNCVACTQPYPAYLHFINNTRPHQSTSETMTWLIYIWVWRAHLHLKLSVSRPAALYELMNAWWNEPLNAHTHISMLVPSGSLHVSHRHHCQMLKKPFSMFWDKIRHALKWKHVLNGFNRSLISIGYRAI